MLNHRNPTVIFTRNGIGFVLDIIEGNLLELGLVGVHSRSRVRVIHRTFAFGFTVIACELVINRRGNLCVAVIDNLMGDIDTVVSLKNLKTLFDSHVTGSSSKDNSLSRDGFLILSFTDDLGAFLCPGILKQGLVVGEIAAD